MANNETHGTFAELLAIAQPELRPVCDSLRNRIVSLDTDFTEIVWPKQKIASFGIGPRKMTEHYAYIGVKSSYVNLGFYHGASLHDPQDILEGTGKNLRHVKIRNVQGSEDAAVIALLRQAIVDRRSRK